MNEGWQDRLEKFGISLYMIRVTIAATLSWLAVYSLYGDRYLYFAPLAAILITQGSVKASLEKGAYRLTGIVLGGLVSLIVGQFLDVGVWSILLILLLGIGAATACRINIQAVSQVGVTSVLTLTFFHDHYIEWRVAETFIGVLIALLINMIIVPPKGFVKVKDMTHQGALLLADALGGLCAQGHGSAKAQTALADSAKLLGTSAVRQKELLYTLAHCSCRRELQSLNRTTGRLKTIHAYVKEIGEELALLPTRYAVAGGISEAMEATADCIVLYGADSQPDTDGKASLPEALRRARELQLAAFAGLQADCPITAIRDLGAVFSHLSRVLDEIERADYAAFPAAAQRVPSGAARSARARGKTPAGLL
ncbi:FUSC family protein [Paenibacillus tengchongensis]|uniref:FUSC family protein n=1 Tax=Paenibacillus tengchongensis TaxID=2608684 RepID=UPI001652111A|nr:FUSC family protein [Paenibacillus tengchongensis]